MPELTLSRTPDKFSTARLYVLTAITMATFYVAPLAALKAAISLGWCA